VQYACDLLLITCIKITDNILCGYKSAAPSHNLRWLALHDIQSYRQAQCPTDRLVVGQGTGQTVVAVHWLVTWQLASPRSETLVSPAVQCRYRTTAVRTHLAVPAFPCNPIENVRYFAGVVRYVRICEFIVRCRRCCCYWRWCCCDEVSSNVERLTTYRLR
jgi:hypothetical protein